VVRSDAEKLPAKPSAAKTKAARSAGCRRLRPPPGATNRPKAPSPHPELMRITRMLTALLPAYHGALGHLLVLDGTLATTNALQMRDSRLHLFPSCLPCGLYFPTLAPIPHRRGPHRKYGPSGRHYFFRPHPSALPQETTGRGTCNLLVPSAAHKEFAHPLNVVIIAQDHLRTQARAHIVLFSSDLTWLHATRDYYVSTVQIEFNFRDANQYWGLEDFMNVTPTGSPMSANLSCSWSMSRTVLRV